MKPKNNDLNAEFAENPQNRLSDGDLISRQAALNMKFSEGYNNDGVIFVPLRDVTEWIKNLPSVQPKRGEWIIMDAGFPVPKCSMCGEKAHMRKRSYYNFCPNCGADMRKRGEADVDRI